MFHGKFYFTSFMSKLEFHLSHSVALSKAGSVAWTPWLLYSRGLDDALAFYTFLSDNSPLPKLARLYLYQVHGE